MKKQFQMSHEDDVAFDGQTVMGTGKHIHNAQGNMPLPPCRYFVYHNTLYKDLGNLNNGIN